MTHQDSQTIPNKIPPVFRQRLKEGKEDTSNGCRLVSGADQSQPHFNIIAQPVFERSEKEGKRDTNDV